MYIALTNTLWLAASEHGLATALIYTHANRR